MMATSAEDHVFNGPGIQHHGRSLLVWPHLLDAGSRTMLSKLLVTGARVLSLSDRLPRCLDRMVPEPVPLGVWHGKPDEPQESMPTEVPNAQEWKHLVQLWRDSGITPLAEHLARADPRWRHAR